MLTIVNGRIWTGDHSAPWARGVSIEGDRIVTVDIARDARNRSSAGGRVIDARGGLVVPGFIDSHIHLLAGGFRLASVQLRDVTSRAEFARRLAAHVRTLAAGEWTIGGDWNHERWGGELPSREWIDPVTADHPVWLNRLDGHMALANSAALQIAGLTKDTANVPGGAIVRDAAGSLTGLLKDAALALVERVIPRPSAAREDRALASAMTYVSSQGVTSVHHMGTIPPDETWPDLAAFRRTREARRQITRISTTVPLPTWQALRDLIASGELGGADGRGDEWLRVGGLKTFVDGSLGSHTAAFHDPYTDLTTDSGLIVTSKEELLESIRPADAAGLQAVVHAIGDRANTIALDVFESVRASNGARDRRFRVEHAQHLRPADLPRFAGLGVIASMQPYHAIDDGCWAERAIGPRRAELSYPWRSLLDAGARVAFGSDWFVAPARPIEGLYAAVTRRTVDGRHAGGWIPAQTIALDQALRAYTADAAYASFEDHLKGRLVPGLLADVTVLDRDLFASPPDEWLDARVTHTIVGGRVVFE